MGSEMCIRDSTREVIDTWASDRRYTDVMKTAEADRIKLIKDEMGRNDGEQMKSGVRGGARFGPSMTSSPRPSLSRWIR